MITPNKECESKEIQYAARFERMVEFSITEQVVLAGQPQPDDWQKLAERGFSTVINIRSDPERAVCQAKKARAAGLNYIYLEVPAYEMEPEHIDAFNNVLNNVNHGKILIHCRTASRTGLLWMLNRVSNFGWSREQAETELQAAGYDEDAMDVFSFCAEDFFERTTVPLELELQY
jgi:uncharacterized protein (TIGR01244 family)